MKKKHGKRLGGEPPRRPGRLMPRERGRQETHVDSAARSNLLGMLVLGLFVMGIVIGFGWSANRKISGGILQQRTTEMHRSDWVPLHSLPSYVPAAFLAVSDPTLLPPGALQAPTRAPKLAARLVRQVYTLSDSPVGDARTIVMGPILKRRLAPSELTELYLNRVYLGKEEGYPVYGLYSASHEYFGQDPQTLTLSQAATLAGLLLPPRIENPDAVPAAVGARRNEVLQRMLEAGLIAPEQYRQAAAEELGFQPGLEQIPMTRPADWGATVTPIRLPPKERPTAQDSTDSTDSTGENRGR